MSRVLSFAPEDSRFTEDEYRLETDSKRILARILD